MIAAAQQGGFTLIRRFAYPDLRPEGRVTANPPNMRYIRATSGALHG